MGNLKCALLVLCCVCYVWAAFEQIPFRRGQREKHQQRRPDQRMKFGVACATCGLLRGSKSANLEVQKDDTMNRQNAFDHHELPMDFYRKLNEVHDEAQFHALIDSFNGGTLNTPDRDDVDEGTRASRAGGFTFVQESSEESDIPASHTIKSGRIPKIGVSTGAECLPENTTVPLIVSDSYKTPFTIQFPTCARVRRCSGCCNTDALHCEATNTSTKSYKVTLREINNNKQRKSSKGSHLVIKLEEHLECKCACRIKQENCTSLQEYNKHACRCVCKNADKRENCDKLKIWDEGTCMCKCRELLECSTGFYFDNNSCRCKSDALFYSYYGDNARLPGSLYHND